MKKIIKLKDLDSWFNDLNKLIQYSFISYNHLKTIKLYQSDNEFLKTDFFLFFRYQQWFMLNIQIAKLLDNNARNQKRNIVTLCDFLEHHEYDDDLNNLLSSDKRGFPRFSSKTDVVIKINDILTQIKQHEKLINKVILARNKNYAHTDVEKYAELISLDEIETLLELVAFAYNNTRGLLYGINTDFSKGIITLTMKDLIRIISNGLPQKNL